LVLGVYVAAQVIVSPLGDPQLVAPYVPLPLPPIVTFAAVGAVPLPAHDNTAVIVTGASCPYASEDGLTLVTLIVVAA
jgi:hypothetical protein